MFTKQIDSIDGLQRRLGQTDGATDRQTTTLLQEPNYRHTHIYTNITMIYLPLSHNQKFEVPVKVVLVP